MFPASILTFSRPKMIGFCVVLRNSHMLRRNWTHVVVCVSKHFIETSSLRNTQYHLQQEPLTAKWNTAPELVLICVLNRLRATFVTNEWDSVPTSSCTDHLPTINRPLTDHLLTNHLPTTFLRCSLFTITHSFIWRFPIASASCDLTQVCLFVYFCSCYTDDSLCGLPGIKTIQTCTPTTKPICGKCESEQYFSKVVDGCMPCSPPCTALQTEVQSCSHEHNRVCQPRPPSTPGGIITLTHSRLIPLSTQGLSSVCISNSKNIPTRNNINVQ